MTINRLVLMKIHALLAVFLLPAAIMFFVTGGLYIWEIKGEEEKTRYEIVLENTFTGDIEEFVGISKTKLFALGLSVPSGKPKIKEEGRVFEWPGSAVEVKVRTDSNMRVAKMDIKESGWYRHLVQLHKAKGGILFKIYATVLSVSLLIILITGFIMAWRMPVLRKPTVAALVSGFAIFLLLVIYS